MISFGPAKILIVLVVALLVLGPEKLPQMTRQVGKAWGDFRRFREHLENEVRGALGEDLNDLREPFTAQWSTGVDARGPEGTMQDGAPGSPGGAEDRAPPVAPGQGTPSSPGTRATGPGVYRGVDPGLPPDDPSLN